MRRLLFVLLLVSGAARAADIVDATGSTVTIPDHVARILPAGPPAAVLLLTLAPDLMLGFPMDVSPEARAYLSPEAAALPRIPRLTGREDVTEQVRALKPDLIVDYGDVTPAYIELAKKTQDKLGVPTILLDGALAKTPEALRVLGTALHRQLRAKAVTTAVSGLLTDPANQVLSVVLGFGAKGSGRPVDPQMHKPRTVVYLRGSKTLRAVAPDTGASEIFKVIGWEVLAPMGTGTFRPVTLEQIASLDPDELIFGDPGMRGIVASSEAWRSLRAVKYQNAFVAPALPFGWIEEPPSINRLFGLEWLTSIATTPTEGVLPGEVANIAASLGGELFDHAPTEAQLDVLVESGKPIGQ